MRWPWERVPVGTESEREARLRAAVDELEDLTKNLKSIVKDVQEGDLGSGRQRGPGV